MTREEIAAIVTEKPLRYKVRWTNGEITNVKMYLFNRDNVVINNKGRKYHHLTDWYDKFNDWKTITPIKVTNEMLAKRVLKRAKKAKSMLEANGYWSHILKEINDFLNLPMSEVEKFVDAENTDHYNLVYKSCGKEGTTFPWLHTTQVFSSFMNEKCWKTPNFPKYGYEGEKELVKQAFNDKTNYHCSWRHGYDNSVEVINNNDTLVAYYSEEYKNCGNGHYYLLFDPTHAIFYEDD